jgi:hypothetical protein
VEAERALSDAGLRLDVRNWDGLSENERGFALLDAFGDGTDLYEYGLVGGHSRTLAQPSVYCSGGRSDRLKRAVENERLVTTAITAAKFLPGANPLGPQAPTLVEIPEVAVKSGLVTVCQEANHQQFLAPA